MFKVTGIDFYNQCTTEGVSKTLNSIKCDSDHTPCVLIEDFRGCWSLDEKMGQTYIHYEQANTLAARDYKQPQAVIYEVNRNHSRPHNSEDISICL